MRGDTPEFAALVARYCGLGGADRKAVRRALSPSEFQALEDACAELDRARGEQALERQYRGYSPWLAALIEQSLGDGRTQLEVTAACRAAIAGAHRSIVGDQDEETLVVRIARLLGIGAPPGGAAGRA